MLGNKMDHETDSEVMHMSRLSRQQSEQGFTSQSR